MASIPYKVFCDAINHFEEYLQSVTGEVPSINNLNRNDYIYSKMKVFLGCEIHILQFEPNTDKQFVLVPRNFVDKWNMLASTHYKTLLKAYEAKYGPLRI